VDFTRRLEREISHAILSQWELDDALAPTNSTYSVYERPSQYAKLGYYPISRALVEDGRKHFLLQGDAKQTVDFPPTCAFHLLHGLCDLDVPWTHAMDLLNRLPLTCSHAIVSGGGSRPNGSCGDGTMHTGYTDDGLRIPSSAGAGRSLTLIEVFALYSLCTCTVFAHCIRTFLGRGPSPLLRPLPGLPGCHP
jgi:hypothetical protein